PFRRFAPPPRRRAPPPPPSAMAGRRAASRAPAAALPLLAALGWCLWCSERPSSFAVPPAAGEGALCAAALRAAAREGAREGCRGSRTCMRAVGLFFSTQTGNTESAAEVIAAKAGLEATDLGDVSAEDLAGYDGIIIGAPTWNTGADEYRTGTTMDDYLDDIRSLSLGGKPVAVFGCGDSQGYGDNFAEAIEEIHGAFKEAGAKMIGYVDASAYQHSESKSEVDGKFVGLPLDQDNEAELTEDRISAWVSQLKSEGMPL
ncbi:unnamed protein product, partial [Prorocentrum cordatum]